MARFTAVYNTFATPQGALYSTPEGWFLETPEGEFIGPLGDDIVEAFLL